MKFKSYLLAAALLLGGAGAAAVGTSVTLAADEPAKVEAADSVVYRIVGDLENYPAENWNGNGNLVLTLGEDGNYHITLNLAVNDAFKFQHDGNYYNETTNFYIDGIQYISGGYQNNYVVKVAGKYDISINAGITSWENWEQNKNEGADGSFYYSPFGFQYLGVSEKVEVTFLDPDGKTVKTVSVPNDTVYTTTWFLVDGYTNVQWYTDEERTKLYVPQILTEDTTLYGKGDVAGPDSVVYFEGTYTHAYYWSEFGDTDKLWPGVELSNSEQVTELNRHYVTEGTVWKITIPGEVQAKNIKFSKGTVESENYALVEGAVYTDAGIHEDKTNAMIFLAAFDELRDDNGDICGILEDSVKYDEVKSLYNTIQDKTLVDSLEDLGAAIKVGDEYEPTTVTIGDTMNYLLVTRGTDVGTGAGLIGSFQKNASDWIAIVSIAAVSVAAAGLFFFIRKRKSAK